MSATTIIDTAPFAFTNRQSVKMVLPQATAPQLNSDVYETARIFAPGCIDPVKICSCYKGERSNECDHGRQHQTLDGEA